ncbi:MAG: hypothetical protein R3E32_01500 [Chitinophagales bacterium]
MKLISIHLLLLCLLMSIVANGQTDEKEAWLTAREYGENLDARGYEYYINNYPNGKNIDQAKENLAAIYIVDGIAWTAVKEEDNIANYNEYISIFPYGLFVNDARQRIRELESYYDNSYSNQNPDEEAWLEATSLNTISAYNNYLQNFPNGDYSENAEEKIRKIQAKIAAEQNDWDTAIGTNTLTAFEEYRKKYPIGKHRKQADSNIASLSKIEILEPKWERNSVQIPIVSQANYMDDSEHKPFKVEGLQDNESFEWNNEGDFSYHLNIKNLEEKPYTLTIKGRNGSMGVKNFEYKITPLILDSLYYDNEKIMITIQGGQIPYTLSWSKRGTRDFTEKITLNSEVKIGDYFEYSIKNLNLKADGSAYNFLFTDNSGQRVEKQIKVGESSFSYIYVSIGFLMILIFAGAIWFFMQREQEANTVSHKNEDKPVKLGYKSSIPKPKSSGIKIKKIDKY